MKFDPQDYLFWTFSLVATKYYYKDIDPCFDLFNEIQEHYKMFFSDDYPKNNLEDLTPQFINYFATLID